MGKKYPGLRILPGGQARSKGIPKGYWVVWREPMRDWFYIAPWWIAEIYRGVFFIMMHKWSPKALVYRWGLLDTPNNSPVRWRDFNWNLFKTLERRKEYK